MAVNLKEKVYCVLQQRLVTGQLPPGSRISELALSRQMGVSRAPVREAVNQLVSEGLLEHVRNAGPRVRKLDQTDVLDLFQLREWLECPSAGEAARSVDDAHLIELEQACNDVRDVARQYRRSEDGTLAWSLHYRVMMADLAFHMTLIRACGNRRVLRFVEGQHILSQIYGFVSERHDLRSLARLYREHSRILRAVRSREAEAARHYMEEHIRRGRDSALARYNQRRRQLAADGEAESTWSAALHQARHSAELGERTTHWAANKEASVQVE